MAGMPINILMPMENRNLFTHGNLLKLTKSQKGKEIVSRLESEKRRYKKTSMMALIHSAKK